MVGATGPDVNLGCDGYDWINYHAGGLRQDVVVQTWTVLDHGGANEWVFGPVDAWRGS